MHRVVTWIQLALAVSVVGALLVAIPAASAKRTDVLTSTGTFEPDATSYTATDDMWSWSTEKNRTQIQSDVISSAVRLPEGMKREGTSLLENDSELLLNHRMKVELRYVPDMDSDSSGMATRTSQEVAVSGRAEGRLSFKRVRTPDLGWFIPDVGDEVVVGALSWDAKASGSGTCTGTDCDIRYEISGKLSDPDGRSNCGELTISGESSVNNAEGEQSWSFSDVSGLGTDIQLSLRVSEDGLACYIGETEKNLRTGEVDFYYGPAVRDIAEAEPYSIDEHINRVMPGDNVTHVGYQDIPVQLVQAADSSGDTLWNPDANPVQMNQSMRVRLERDSENNSVTLRGGVRGVFQNRMVAEGWISGDGTCDGNACTIQMIRTFEIFDALQRTRCGVMELAVTVDYVHGANPEWTFRPDGTGVVTLENQRKCALDS